MAKKVYITNEQYNVLKKVMTEEEGKFETNLVNDRSDLTKPIGALLKDKEQQAREAGIDPKKLELVAPVSNTASMSNGSVSENKKYTKKQIEESRINRILKNSVKYTKADFEKKFI